MWRHTDSGRRFRESLGVGCTRVSTCVRVCACVWRPLRFPVIAPRVSPRYKTPGRVLACTRASYVHEWILPVYAAERAPTRLDLCVRYRHVGVSAAMQRVSMKEELVIRYFALLARAIGNRRMNGASEMGSRNVCIYIRIYMYIYTTRAAEDSSGPANAIPT